MRSLTEKAEKHIDILFGQYIIKKIFNILAEMTRKNKLLNIRILMPSSKLDEEVILELTSNINSIISIKYFDAHLSSYTITSILDSGYMYILGFDSENSDDDNWYFIQHVNNESRILVYTVLFEKMWLLQKSVDFG
jgi:hypothetical protein